MRALINSVERWLQDNNELRHCRIKAYGLTEYELPDPDMVPYINIKPRTKSRERIMLIGGDRKIYNVEPEIEIHVWESSVNTLKEAFERCEDLAEDVLDYMANLSAINLGVDWHQEQIESYEDGNWEGSFYYMAIILMRAKKDEEHT